MADYMHKVTNDASFGVLPVFSINHEFPHLNMTTASTTNSDRKASSSQQRTHKHTELKFKIESIGMHPEEDEDLDTCPARTRPHWPSTIQPYWKPTSPAKKDKPPFSYATLIAHAIFASKDGRLLLSEIYDWISKTYPYYTRGGRNWQNSIRHNLSLNKKWFLKIDRQPTQANPGKGCYWTLVAGTEQHFIENLTQIGGHSRKHHDIGLTSDLSVNRLDLCFSYQLPQQPTHQFQSQKQQPNANTTTLNEHTLCITRPEDFRAPKKRLSPTFATFRVGPAPNAESKSRKRKHRRTTKSGSYCDNDDEDAGYDSGFELDSKESSGKKRVKTEQPLVAPTAEPATIIMDHPEFASPMTNDLVNANSWSSEALSMPLPDSMMTIPYIDPILGNPDDSFFSQNGFYISDLNSCLSADQFVSSDDQCSPHSWMGNLVPNSTSNSYPSLLVSPYEPSLDESLATDDSKFNHMLFEALQYQVSSDYPIRVNLEDEVANKYLHFDDSEDIRVSF